MTIEEITEIVSTAESRLSEIKTIIADMNSCQSDKSKTILLAAASKYAETFKTIKG